VSAVATKRCGACGDIALISDRGRVKAVGGTAFTHMLPNGDLVFACACGAIVVWERSPMRSSTSCAT
jgi:hypothetical protein